MATSTSDNPLISALQSPQRYDHPAEPVDLIETHISWVLLAGDYAYKLRKPVDFGFLDFTTLKQRYDDCCHELRLNRRFSPELYVGLVRIGGTPQAPILTMVDASLAFESQPCEPQALDYAVKMNRFAQSQLLSERQRQRDLPEAALDQLAQQLAEIHATAPSNPTDSRLGHPDTVNQVMMQNFEQISPYLQQPADSSLLSQLDRLHKTSQAAFDRALPLLTQRHQQGNIRECHGDLHLGNIALVNGRACPFDCIEFNPRYRWIDPLSDLAFLLMDLQLHDQPALANRLLNRYLEQSLDYSALPLLPLYLAYRAMVRAKVLLLGLGDPNLALDDANRQQLANYQDLAERLLTSPKAQLVLMQGVSGSGKSWLSQQLIDSPATREPWIRLRSDLIRQQLHQQNQPDASRTERYSEAMSRLTYQRLLTLSQQLLQSGYNVIVDAAFLQQQQRQPFLALAQQHSAELCLLCCSASQPVLEQRVKQRFEQGKDPSEATVEVLRQQLSDQQPLLPHEQSFALMLDTGHDDTTTAALARLAR